MNDLKLVFRSLKESASGNEICELSPGQIHGIGFACNSLDGGVRQEVQLLRWTQANQLNDLMDKSSPLISTSELLWSEHQWTVLPG